MFCAISVNKVVTDKSQVFSLIIALERGPDVLVLWLNESSSVFTIN